LAVSGQDTIDHHGHLAKGAVALSRAVCRLQETVEYAADEPEATREGRPLDVSEALDQFVGAAECRHAMAVPLKTDDKTVGVLVAERVADPGFTDTAKSHLELMAQEGGIALDNASSYKSIPLLGAMRGLRWIIRRGPSRLLVVAAIAAALTYVFGWTTGTLWLDGDAKIFPEEQRTIYVETAGIVDKILVKHGQKVKVGQALVVIRNRDLELKHAEAAAQRERTKWTISQLESQHNKDPRDLQISGQLEQNRARLAGLVREHKLLGDQLERLKLLSPIDGIVTTLDIQEKLAGKPVNVGDDVLKVASTDSWIVKLYLPEDRMGDLLRAEAESGENPDGREAKFYLTSHPGRTFYGKVVHIGSAAEVVGEENVVVLRIKPKDLDVNVKPEMGARAKVKCGSRALGYVWFRELIQFVQTRLLF
jgi:multidrug resistance efflux pump